jgi:hypothetical protein
MKLQLDRRKSFYPTIHPGAYPLGLIGAFVFGENGSGAAGTPQPDISFYDAVTRQAISYGFNGVALNLKAAIQGAGGIVNYNNSAGGYSLSGTTRAYDPRAWVILGGIQAATTASLVSKNDNDLVNAGWMHSISAAGGMDFSIEFASVDMHVRAAPAGIGPWAECVHNFAFTWDGTTTAANQHIWIDGIEQSHSVDTNGSGIHGSDATNPLLVTQNRNGSAFGGSNGIMESFFLFNRKLSPAEIQEMFVYPYRTYTSAVDTMLLAAANIFTQDFDASMQTFDGVLTTHAILGHVKALAATMSQMAATLATVIGELLSASMATFDAALATIFIPAGSLTDFNASMSTFAGVLTAIVGKNLNAGMLPFNATLSMAVTHGGVPPTCIPAGCDTLPVLISHVEQCENPGS